MVHAAFFVHAAFSAAVQQKTATQEGLGPQQRFLHGYRLRGAGALAEVKDLLLPLA